MEFIVSDNLPIFLSDNVWYSIINKISIIINY